MIRRYEAALPSSTGILLTTPHDDIGHVHSRNIWRISDVKKDHEASLSVHDDAEDLVAHVAALGPADLNEQRGNLTTMRSC